MLISAYDIHYGHLPKPERFPCTPTLTFVDSGGYETNSDLDLSAVYRFGAAVRRWGLRDYIRIIDHWPAHIAAAFVSFDREAASKPLRQQIAAANTLFRRYRDHLTIFLLKPSRRARHRVSGMLDEVRTAAGELASFGILGVTEKDLADTTLDRMTTVAHLRTILDEQGVHVPIQIFGALDPISSPLYFIAGAELFDGLTWTRFAYQDQHCVYIQNYGVTTVGIDAHDDFVKSKILSDNYASLRDLQLSMHRFAATHDFSHFNRHEEHLRRAAESLEARLRGGAR
jgi:hypothetical protein